MTETRVTAPSALIEIRVDVTGRSDLLLEAVPALQVRPDRYVIAGPPVHAPGLALGDHVSAVVLDVGSPSRLTEILERGPYATVIIYPTDGAEDSVRRYATRRAGAYRASTSETDTRTGDACIALAVHADELPDVIAELEREASRSGGHRVAGWEITCPVGAAVGPIDDVMTLYGGWHDGCRSPEVGLR